MKQRQRKRALDQRTIARIGHAHNREALMHRGMRASLSWFAVERDRIRSRWRKTKRAHRKRVKFFGGTQWSQRTIRLLKLSAEAEAALAAGIPIGRDGQPADPEKFGLIAIEARH